MRIIKLVKIRVEETGFVGQVHVDSATGRAESAASQQFVFTGREMRFSATPLTARSFIASIPHMKANRKVNVHVGGLKVF
ncbi:MAG: hypothetical protein ACYC7A_20815 [Thermoanaerobaculia bacterium]